jgi:UDP-N-acetylmuramoyl-L-alanyl-D-glutamate--2,6-diaminopimelate ligase
MLLQDMLKILPEAEVYGASDVEVTSIAYDSRAVRPGSLFIAIKGFHTDGHAYIPQALAAGAAAVVYEDALVAAQLSNVPHVRVPHARVALAPIAAAFYGHPGDSLRVIGITGTDGKTTTTFLTSAALEAGSHTTGFMGTVDFKIASRQWANTTRQSTPEALEVQAMLREMVEAGCTHAVLEATSHALSNRWNRLGGCAFDVAVLTNVTTEHLDFHGSVEQYRRDKARLFEMLGEQGAGHIDKRRKIAIVNADDPNHQMFLDAAPAYAERLTYAVNNPADVRARHVRASREGLFYHVSTPWGEGDVRLKLTGDFNVSNTLAALTVALAEGVPLDAAVARLGAIPGVRGRMERVEQGQPFTVLVDYAHTPGSFEKLMNIVRPLTDKKLIVVFGSAGERDREKRPMQGEIAARFCDLLVLTDEDPRLEDREAIIAEIAVGAERAGKREGSGYLRIPDRATAIREAFRNAGPGDIVLLLGKGHEGSIIYAHGSIPWDEAGEARAALRELGYGGKETNQKDVV